MQIGDLVTHKHLGGCGIIVNTKMVHSNITFGWAEKLVIAWFDSPSLTDKAEYFQCYIELVESADKN